MEKIALIGTIKRWDEERGVYQPVKSIEMTKVPVIEFGGLEISHHRTTPIVDPADKTSAIVLERKKRVPSENINIFEFRPSFKLPRKHVVGKTMLIDYPFYLSHLYDFWGVQIYKGDPAKHPEMLEITPATKIGEGSPSLLL